MSSIFTIAVLGFVLAFCAMPTLFLDRNSTALICQTKQHQNAVTKALAAAIGHPRVTLNTAEIDRYFFHDGTSIERSKRVFMSSLPYEVAAWKTIALRFFSKSTPLMLANRMAESLRADGFSVHILSQPDPAFPDGTIVLLLSSAFCFGHGGGYGILVRKHVLKVNGGYSVRFQDFD